MSKTVLFKVCAAAIVLSALLLRLDIFFARMYPLGGDDANYIKLAWSMRYANSLDVTSGLMFSFGYSIFILLASFIISNLDVAATAVSFVFGVASVLLVVLLGRLLFGRPTALIAGFGLAFFVPHIMISTLPMSQSTFIFFMLLSVYLLAVGTVKARPLYYYFLCGLVFGYCFIVRSEIEVVFAAAVLVSLYVLRVRHHLPAKRLFLITVFLAAAFIAINIPKIMWLHDITGSWMLDHKENYVMAFIGKYQDDLGKYSYIEMNEHLEESMYGLGPDGKPNLFRKYNFLKWLLESPSKRLSYYWKNVGISLKNITWSVAVLMALAVPAFLLGRKEDRYGTWLTASLFSPIFFVPFFYSIGGHSWYGQWEPSVEFAPPLMLLAAHGLWLALERAKGALAGKWKDASYAGLAMALVVWGTPTTLREIRSIDNICEQRSHPGERLGGEYTAGTLFRLLDQRIGLLLNDRLPKGAKIMTRSWAISRYSNREVAMLPYGSYPEVIDNARNNGVDYIVIGGAECLRPDLDFLVEPSIHLDSPYWDASVKDLQLVMSYDSLEIEGRSREYYLTVYRLKKQGEE